MKVTEVIIKYLTETWSEEEKEDIAIITLEFGLHLDRKLDAITVSRDIIQETYYLEKLAQLHYASSLILASEFNTFEAGRDAFLYYEDSEGRLEFQISLESHRGKYRLDLSKEGVYRKISSHHRAKKFVTEDDEDPVLCHLRDSFDAIVVYKEAESLEIPLKGFSFPLRWSFLDMVAEGHFGEPPKNSIIKIPLIGEEYAEIDNEGKLIFSTTAYSDNLEKILKLIEC